MSTISIVMMIVTMIGYLGGFIFCVNKVFRNNTKAD